MNMLQQNQMDKRQLALIEIELAFVSISNFYINRVMELAKPEEMKKPKNKKKKVVEGEANPPEVVAEPKPEVKKPSKKKKKKTDDAVSVADIIIELEQAPELTEIVAPDPMPDPNFDAIPSPKVHRAEIISFMKLADTYIGMGELEDLPTRIGRFADFAKSYIDDGNPTLCIVSRQIYPSIQKLKSLTHIAWGHPEDAAKRAKKISNKVSSL